MPRISILRAKPAWGALIPKQKVTKEKMTATPNIITIVGQLTEDPQVRTLQNGIKVANVSIASSGRSFDRESNEWKDKPAVFYRGSVWRRGAENVEASLKKGSRVIAIAEAVPNSYEKDGVTINTVQYEILEIGASLEFATAALTKNQSNGSSQQSAPAAQAQPAQQATPAASPAQAAPAQAPAPAVADDDDFS